MLPYDKFYRKLKKRLTGQSALAILEPLTTQQGEQNAQADFPETATLLARYHSQRPDGHSRFAT